MTNIQTIIHDRHRVTSNQAELFDKLISKYAKQLAKTGLVKDELKALPWKAIVVQSTPEYTGATVSLVGDDIILRTPFNKQFIAKFSEYRNDPFEWVREDKIYRAPCSTYALKILYNILPKYFSIVNYNEPFGTIISQLKSYEGLVWEPTLRSVQGRLILAPATPVIADLISDIDLVLDATTLYKLSQYSIAIDQSTIGDDPKLKFAAEYITEIDLDHFDYIIPWMEELGVEYIMMGRGLNQDKDLRRELELKISQSKIKVVNSTIPHTKTSLLLVQAHGTLIRSVTEIGKIVVLKNGRPIEVK
jgi:hypothetical protein